jgi:hypothetical protein
MKNVIRILLIVLVAAVFGVSKMSTSAEQQRKDSFSHASASHKKLQCSACHKVPSGNWTATSGFPDIKDYPGHASCFGCHSPRTVFVGNKPTFCAICHVDPGPRGVARLAFPARARSEEFSTIFPHNVHQDVIASAPKQAEENIFVKASFVRSADDAPQFNNCTICHTSSKELPKLSPRIDAGLKPLADAAPDAFTPKAGYFREMPQGHASCFSCHYQGIKPAAANCAGCHALTVPHNESTVVERYSVKFDHQQKDHVTKDCMTCHVRIAQNADVRTLKNADVPMLTCSTSSCHQKKVLEEIGMRETSIAEKKAPFQCSYCHSTAIGRFPVPPSHLQR